MVIQTKELMSVEEYFEWELLQEERYEYIDGELIKMPGVSDEHGQITMNIILTLGNAVDLSRYAMRPEGMRVQISPTRYVYPDLSIIRGDPVFREGSKYNLMNPCFVLEVTSPSSRARDRSDKLGYYFAVPSIEACLIVDQHRLHAELYTRGDSDWRRQAFSEPADVISLAMLDCELPLEQVYRGISFAER